MSVWLGVLFGRFPAPHALLPTIWHGHEMIYGVAVAVIGGFVLTATQNWTGIRGVHGWRLQSLVGLWLAARILLLVLPAPHPVAMVVDLSFYPCLGYLLFPYLKDPELKIERVFFLYFVLFFSGNLLIHLDALGWVPGVARPGLLLGLYTVVAVIVFMGGRVIPFFTESSIAKVQPRTYPSLEVASHLSMWSFLATQILASESSVAAGVAFLAAGIHFWRLIGWQVKRVRRVPLVWVLHVAYGWLGVGFLLSGLASLRIIAPALAVHALTVGCLGGMIYGMMARVSLGHTGRRLHPSVLTVVGFWFINLAAVIRVFGPMISGAFYLGSIGLSGTLWIIAFALFVWQYAPLLLRPRLN